MVTFLVVVARVNVGVNGVTAESLATQIASYPFEISIESSSSTVSSGGGETKLKLYIMQ